jgi:chloramphenicol 3-O-phosphotransferase
MEGEERLNLANNLAAGAVGFEYLIEEAKEGAPHAIDALAAVGAFVGLGEQARRQQWVEQLFEVGEALLAEVSDPMPQVGQPGAERGKERCVHRGGIYTASIDAPATFGIHERQPRSD